MISMSEAFKVSNSYLTESHYIKYFINSLICCLVLETLFVGNSREDFGQKFKTFGAYHHPSGTPSSVFFLYKAPFKIKPL